MPIRLPSNRPADRFYRGGARICAFRAEPPPAGREPEDWIASTTTVAGEARTGLTVLPDGPGGAGILLRDAVTADPVHWLGRAHAQRWGADTRLLVKLLDAGQRLPVHAHPDDAFAAAHLGRAHGKAEAWYILSGGAVHLGLRDDIDADRLAGMVARQETDEMLALLHRVDVHAGDVVWVPPGELHAIGEGVLLLELQQPEDLSILLEWRGFALDGAADGHVGIGFDRALTAVNRRARSAAEIAGLVHPAPAENEGSVLPAAADEYFRLERHVLDGAAIVAAGFAVVVVTAGEVVIGGAEAGAGTTWLIAAAEGDVVASGRGELLVARPPAP
ncbi:hypothetical protein HMPREF1529_01353 [Microbacterium sp. oral taxon 186 str. F0373]|jgi:mannose-6-phosphate isomerase|uniref:class I mannose-6-phosphate isomerase n=1 Tax=Microbacterium sp. oral taxon 186 TaxID=712383 RepID=UPI0002587268|nr:class I mannose-6-phosphate isomerase [Microbacterium sp. oral taxon 186]EIC08358.1 PfkB domain-containing protein [Microbacterium laevaniformans OR221]EPD84748.1 hypothetical protein HMPREF1529_01353 [Microbacterium sp. oral taxon 186 str. F0373]